MCLDMNRLFLIILLLASCSGEQPDYSWLEREWVSDTEASLSINTEYAELDAETLRILRETYGKIKWTIRGNTMKFFDDRYNLNAEFDVTFTIMPIDSVSFKMEIPDESYIIWKTDSGFCKALSPDYLSKLGIEDKNAGLECFRPSGT
jgi:hypothetical protein